MTLFAYLANQSVNPMIWIMCFVFDGAMLLGIIMSIRALYRWIDDKVNPPRSILHYYLSSDNLYHHYGNMAEPGYKRDEVMQRISKSIDGMSYVLRRF